MHAFVTVVLTFQEAERLYLAAAVYESTVHRMIADPDVDAIAHSGMRKLAQAIVDAQPEDQETF